MVALHVICRKCKISNREITATVHNNNNGLYYINYRLCVTGIFATEKNRI